MFPTAEMLHAKVRKRSNTRMPMTALPETSGLLANCREVGAAPLELSAHACDDREVVAQHTDEPDKLSTVHDLVEACAGDAWLAKCVPGREVIVVDVLKDFAF